MCYGSPDVAICCELDLTATLPQHRLRLDVRRGSVSIPQTTSIIRTLVGIRSIAGERTASWKCLQVLGIPAQRMAIGFLARSGLPLRSPLTLLTTFMFGI